MPSKTASPPAGPAPIPAAWHDDPVLFCREALRAEPQAWQVEALGLVAHHDRVAIRSGHGVGKTALLAWLILWFLITRRPVRIPCTAPTSHQLGDILWSEIAKWRRRLPAEFAAQISVTGEHVYRADSRQECFAVARTARRDQPEAFQGFHGENLLFVVDEASGVDDSIFEVGEGALSTAGAKVVLAGNPTRRSGYFYNAFHRDSDAWKTLRVACADSPMVAARYASGMARRYGADSNIYRVRVLGEFPASEDDVVIPVELCDSAVHRDVEPLPDRRIIWGLDVARFGADRTALAKRRGNVLLEPVKHWRNKDLMASAERVADEYNACEEADRPFAIMVDSIGYGAGVADRLRAMGLPARDVNVGNSSEMPRYERLRDELWWRAREWLDTRTCVLPDDQDLIGELTVPKYSFTPEGKIKVEGKDEIKKRSLQSPDLADAFCLTLAWRADKIPDSGRGRYARRRKQPAGSWMSA
ncbi:MAG TPA: terminase B [Alphaproteobacteria bacterium]|nr:terminase B [Alphaproteobacteria bacterium]